VYVGLAIALAVGAAVLLAMEMSGKSPGEQRSPSGLPEGPLRDRGNPPTAASQPVSVGEPFTYGLLYLTNPTDHSLVIDEITLIQATRITGCPSIPYTSPPLR
jgi:hypothetical protein